MQTRRLRQAITAVSVGPIVHAIRWGSPFLFGVNPRRLLLRMLRPKATAPGCHSWHSKACSVQPARSIPNTGTSTIYYGREGKCNAPVELSRVRAERSDKT